MLSTETLGSTVETDQTRLVQMLFCLICHAMADIFFNVLVVFVIEEGVQCRTVLIVNFFVFFK